MTTFILWPRAGESNLTWKKLQWWQTRKYTYFRWKLCWKCSHAINGKIKLICINHIPEYPLFLFSVSTLGHQDGKSTRDPRVFCCSVALRDTALLTWLSRIKTEKAWCQISSWEVTFISYFLDSDSGIRSLRDNFILKFGTIFLWTDL